MAPRIGDLGEPAAELGIEIVEVPKTAGQEEILTDVAIGPLDFAFRLRPIRPAGPRLITVVIGKRDQRRVVNHGAILVGAGDHGLHAIVEDLFGHAAELGKRVDMAAKHGRQLLVRAEPAPEKTAVAEAPW